jgi:uncharacterized repeat protein (TIGR01451 family)
MADAGESLVSVSDEAKLAVKWTFVGAVITAVIGAAAQLIPAYLPGKSSDDGKGTNQAAGAPQGGASQATAAGQIAYKIQFKNTGTVQVDDVVVKVKLPDGVTYMLGTTQFAASTTKGKWAPVTSDTIAKQGLNIGSYAPGGNGWLRFVSKMGKESAGLCSASGLTAEVEAAGKDGKSSKSSLQVQVIC